MMTMMKMSTILMMTLMMTIKKNKPLLELFPKNKNLPNLPSKTRDLNRENHKISHNLIIMLVSKTSKIKESLNTKIKISLLTIKTNPMEENLIIIRADKDTREESLISITKTSTMEARTSTTSLSKEEINTDLINVI